MNAHNDVVVIGAGPAGIATAIAASQRGFQVAVLDARVPPIDKSCGEGILPRGVAALHALGISLDSGTSVPFRGIRFEDEESSACGLFPDGAGFALRRTELHNLLVERAVQTGVEFLWGTGVTQIDSDIVTASGDRIPYRWLVGADGQNSAVRKWAGLASGTARGKRFGFRRHFEIAPWSNVVEVYWGEGCQMYVTPTGEREVGVAVFSRDPQLRLDGALERFPDLTEKLSGATSTTSELGDTTCLRELPSVTQGCIALVGDASGTVDAITGQGLTLAFEQALHLAEALEQQNLSLYESSHRKLSLIPVAMSRLMFVMERSDELRRRTLRLFKNSPGLFAKLLSIHAGTLPLSSIGVCEMANLGWKLLKA